MLKLLPYFFPLFLASWGYGDVEEGYPNFDDRLAITKIMNTAVIGEWNEFSNKSLPFDEFRQKLGLQYLRADQFPFSGCYVQLDSYEKIRNLRYFINGLPHGPIITWGANGRKLMLGNYQDGKKHGLYTFWSVSGSKVKEQNYRGNKLDGISIRWYQNGQKSLEQIFQNGSIITAIGWMPDGTRCPSTRVINGAGVVVFYDDKGEETSTLYSNDIKSVEHYENGNVREEGYYKNKKKDGTWIYYRPNGVEHFRTFHKDGIRQSTKFSNSILAK